MRESITKETSIVTMKIIKNKFIPFKGYKLMNFFGIIFQRNDTVVTMTEYNHEKIHLKQMQEMLWIGFYLWYAIEYLCIMLSCKWNKQSDRYHDVSFEEEAHNNDKNLNYCKERKHYAWFKYLKIGSYKSKKEK